MLSNFVAQRMPTGQFNIYATALSALGVLAIPALGMQTVFAAQSAGAESDERRRELATTMRWASGLLAVVWLGLAAWWWLREQQIMVAYNLSQPAMLWVLLFIVLATLWTSVLFGTLQGRQDFLTLGWVTLLNGLGRFVVLFAVVRGLGGGALGGLIGVLAGTALVLGIVTWRTWPLLTGPHGAFRWREWLQRLIPMTLGLGALTIIMQADAFVVREKLQPYLTGDETDGYSAVRNIAMALVFVIGGITTVMFPKVARSFHLSEKTDALKLTLLLTAAIGILGATLATAFPELPLRILSPGRLFASKALVPAYCWAIVPMALANVIIWSLLARENYRIVPWLASLAVAYRVALDSFHDRLLTVIGVAGAFGVLLLVVCLFFLWLDGGTTAAKPAAQEN
jgi:O-antigen/teichoic acid export membrane protein